jgi:lipopolysaccharide/colanic/teichoic acid biosynthesis glycosyltransferase
MYLFLKRLLDIFIATFALILFSPILIPIAIALRFSGEGEILYLQERIGLNNKRFDIWKFATMLKNSPQLGTGDVTLKDDPRVLPIGKFLRKTKINELPQIINVLKGDMNIVGARPLMDVSFNLYQPEVQEKIYGTRPGITGVGSIIFRDEESLIEKSDLPPREFYKEFIIPYKGQLEIWYQRNKSIWVDIKVIFLTAWVILFPKSDLPSKLLSGLPKRSF